MRFESELLGATVNLRDKIIFFWGGIFSQWAEGNFVCTSLGETVNCAEQAMMLHKAKTFNDMESYERILNLDHPRDQKMAGRMIKGYDDKIWAPIRYHIVKDINIDKFSQSKSWKELLFLTDPYEIVEASPSDPIWDIGMGVDNPNLLNRSKWGTNLLGKAIVEARIELMNKL